MKGYEAAKKLGMKSGDFCEKYDLNSHMQSLPEELEAELFGSEKKILEEQTCTETSNTAETVVVASESPVEAETPAEATATLPECPVSLETLKTSLRGGGNKSPYWQWRGLVA